MHEHCERVCCRRGDNYIYLSVPLFASVLSHMHVCAAMHMSSLGWLGLLRRACMRACSAVQISRLSGSGASHQGVVGSRCKRPIDRRQTMKKTPLPPPPNSILFGSFLWTSLISARSCASPVTGVVRALSRACRRARTGYI